jgi:hypothetical protein
MDLGDWIKVFDRLTPRSRAWGLIIDRPLKRLFQGLSIIPHSIYEHICSLFLEAFPQSTTRNVDFSFQFGSVQTLTADEIAAEWAAVGGQDPKYFQDVLHKAGFTTCYVHEWWVPGSNPVEARNPIELVETSRVLVNDVTHSEPRYKWQCGDGITQCVDDASIQCGAYDEHHLVAKRYPCPDIPDEYPNYFYVCAYTWPQYAIVPYSSLRKLIRLCYIMKPMHLRIILRVSAYDDGPVESSYDIQDTWWHDIQLQDQVSDPSPEETIQDYY